MGYFDVATEAGSGGVGLHGWAGVERLLASCFSEQVVTTHGCSSCLKHFVAVHGSHT